MLGKRFASVFKHVGVFNANYWKPRQPTGDQNNCHECSTVHLFANSFTLTTAGNHLLVFWRINTFPSNWWLPLWSLWMILSVSQWLPATSTNHFPPDSATSMVAGSPLWLCDWDLNYQTRDRCKTPMVQKFTINSLKQKSNLFAGGRAMVVCKKNAFWFTGDLSLVFTGETSEKTTPCQTVFNLVRNQGLTMKNDGQVGYLMLLTA